MDHAERDRMGKMRDERNVKVRRRAKEGRKRERRRQHEQGRRNM